MKQENRRGKTLSVVMSATLAATFGVPALAVADEAVSTPAAEKTFWTEMRCGMCTM